MPITEVPLQVLGPRGHQGLDIPNIWTDIRHGEGPSPSLRAPPAEPTEVKGERLPGWYVSDHRFDVVVLPGAPGVEDREAAHAKR